MQILLILVDFTANKENIKDRIKIDDYRVENFQKAHPGSLFILVFIITEDYRINDSPPSLQLGF